MGAVVQLCFQTKKNNVIISFFLFSFNFFALFFLQIYFRSNIYHGLLQQEVYSTCD